jgi:hypothetical protein
MQPPDDLLELATAVALARELPLQARLWLAEGVRRLAAGDDQRDCFPVKRETPQRAQRRQRDSLVRYLAAQLPQGTRWERAQAIADLLQHPDAEGVPAALVELARGIREKGGPIGARQIYRILRQSL